MRDAMVQQQMETKLQLEIKLLDEPRAKGVEEQRDGDEGERDEGEQGVAPAHVEGGVHADSAEREEGAGQGTQDSQGGRDGRGSLGIDVQEVVLDAHLLQQQVSTSVIQTRDG